MESYAIQVASIYPIELHACAMAAFYEPKSKFNIYLNEEPDITANPQNRKYVARSSFPSFSWEQDPNNVWRLLHKELEDKSNKEQLFSLTEIITELCSLSLESSSEIMARWMKFKVALEEKPSDIGHWQTSWGCLTSRIIKRIFNELFGNRVEVINYTPYRDGSTDTETSTQAILSLIEQIPKESTKFVSFFKGGYIENFDKVSLKWVKISYIRRKFETLFFYDKIKQELFKIPLSNIDSYAYRFGGPLEILLLQNLGKLIDLPWFCLGDYSENGNGKEFVTPISCVDEQRVRGNQNFPDYRLAPTGYSMIESNNKVIWKYIERVLNCSNVIEETLNDWRSFSIYYPRVQQKLAKHQKPSAKYGHAQIQNWTEYLAQNYDSKKFIDFITPSKSELDLGEKICKIISILKLVTQVHYNSGSYSFTNRNLINAANELKTLNRYKNFLSIKIIKWLKKNKMPLSQYKLLVKKIRDCKFDLGSNIKISDYIELNDYQRKNIGYVISVLSELMMKYYEFVGFCVGALFKNNIFIQYMLLGKDEYLNCIKNTIERRTIKYNEFQPVLIEI